MPTYTYKREDGSVFEQEQRITEDALTTCPTTGQKVKRIISGGAGLVFKGSGFYLTDYVKNGGNGTKSSKDSTDGKDTNTDKAASSSSKSETSSEKTTNSKDTPSSSSATD